MRCINCMRTLDKSGACPHCGFDAATYKPPDDALPPGSSLNDEKYVVGRVLGRGGFGITYVALDQNLGLRVAVKECLPQNAAWRDGGASVKWRAPVHEQESMMENFVREARKMAQIYGISGVVPVREYFYDNETAYIVMDYVEGETLLERLRRTGALNAKECFRLLSPVMDSLAQAHKRGLVHRDIKPNNIMIGRIMDGDEMVWLLDLGAAKDLGTRLSAPNVSAESRIIGTPGYTPLEQCSPDGRIGPWTDVYAMSATFFYCMTGKKPPNSQSRALEEQPPQVLLSVQGPVGDVLRKGMALRPGERYQSMEELRDALEKAVNDTADTQDYDDQTEVLVKDRISKQEKAKPEKSQIKEPRRKPTLAVLIGLALAVCVFGVVMFLRREPPAEIVASGECGESASWTLDANGLLTISGAGDMANYGNAPLNTPWAERKDEITRIKIQNGVASIGACAFDECGNLQSVEIPDSVTAIGEGAFHTCGNLKNIEIPDSVTTIGRYALASCEALKSVKISDNVETIGEWAFADSGLTSVEIPDSVTAIGPAAFYECANLSNLTLSNHMTQISADCFGKCSNLISVEIPDSVTAIGQNAFRECVSLNSVAISQNVTTIGEYAFSGCTSLASASVPAGAAIADNAFDENTAVTIQSAEIANSASADSIMSGECGENASWTLYKSLGRLTISGTGPMADYTDSFAGQEAPWVDYKNSIFYVEILDGITKIGNYAFYQFFALQGVEIPDSVTEIGECAFCSCSGLSKVAIPESVTKIATYAFLACSSLANIEIPNSVTEIGDSAFGSCSSLTNIVIPDSVTSISDGAFNKCTALTSVSVPESVTQIGNRAFSECSNLKSVKIPDSVTKIGYDAFQSCTALTDINIPNGVTKIESATFGECGSLTSISIPGSVLEIGGSAFDSCTNLKQVTISEGVTVILDFAFGGCTALENITLPNSMYRIGEFVFVGCTGLTSVTIPDSVAAIEEGAFRGCGNLASVSVPAGTMISNAFDETTTVIRR